MTERKIRKLILKSIPIETDRLTIRYIEIKDAYDMYEYASMDEVCKYLLWSPHLNIEATKGYIEYLGERYKKGLYADWAVILKDNGKMIGTCGYANVDSSENACEIGYVLSPYYRKKGYMTEAVNAILDLSFNVCKFEKAKLRIISENTDSIKLAERIGFVFDGYTNLIIKDKKRLISNYSLMNDCVRE